MNPELLERKIEQLERTNQKYAETIRQQQTEIEESDSGTARGAWLFWFFYGGLSGYLLHIAINILKRTF